MESIFNVKVATNLKKEAEKVQRQKSFFFAQIPPAFIQCNVKKHFLGHWQILENFSILGHLTISNQNIVH